MHWTIGLVLLLLAAFALGGYLAKTYPGYLPVIS